MVSARNVQTRLLGARHRPRRERYGRPASAERSRRALFAELEGSFRCFPPITRLRIPLTGTPPPPSSPIWARRGALATRRTRPRPHHARATRTPTPSHVIPSSAGRDRTTCQPLERGARPHHRAVVDAWGGEAVRRRAQHDHGRRLYAPIVRRPGTRLSDPEPRVGSPWGAKMGERDESSVRRVDGAEGRGSQQHRRGVGCLPTGVIESDETTAPRLIVGVDEGADGSRPRRGGPDLRP